MRLPHLFLAIFTILIWGFNFVFIKIGLSGIPPIFLVFCRFFLTCFPAIFFVKRPEIPFTKLLSYGLVMFALQFTLLFSGMYVGVTPGIAALILQVQVFFTIFLGVIILKEKLHKLQIVGALVAIGGITCIGLHLQGEVSIAGFLLILGAAAAWAPGNVISKKIGSVNILSLVVWSSLIAWPPLLLASFCIEGSSTILNSLATLQWKSIGAVCYITYMSTLFGFCTWNHLIQRYTLGTIAPFSLLSPVVGILGSVLVFNEPLQSWKILAGSLIISGLCINLLSARRATATVKLPES